LIIYDVSVCRATSAISNRYAGIFRGFIAFKMMLFYVLLIIFVATLIRSTFGFGEALVAVPLLALLIPITIATPLASLLSVTIGGIIVLQDWRHIHFRSASWLIGATIFGIPIGLWLLTSSHPALVKVVLALTIIVFSLYSLLTARRMVLERDDMRLLLACGFTAGILGGAYGMNGPPLAIYGAMRRWSAQHFRATLQAYFLPASLIALVGYWWAGLWTPAVTRYYLLSLPVAIPAIFLGRFFNHRMKGDGFVKYVYFGLMIVGLLLLLEAFRGKL
jgi:uncharacterized membrane protein YfcA